MLEWQATATFALTRAVGSLKLTATCAMLLAMLVLGAVVVVVAVGDEEVEGMSVALETLPMVAFEPVTTFVRERAGEASHLLTKAGGNHFVCSNIGLCSVV